MARMAAPLPHEYPFRLVDSVLERPEPASVAAAPSGSAAWQGRVLARISANARMSMGQAWALPALLAEAIAQAALLLEGGDPEIGRRGWLAGIEEFEVTRAPLPGESLLILVRLAARFGPLVKFEGEVRADDQTIARGAILVKKGESGAETADPARATPDT